MASKRKKSVRSPALAKSAAAARGSAARVFERDEGDARASAPARGTKPISNLSVLAWVSFAFALILAVAWVFAHAFLVDAVIVRLCEMFDRGIPPEKRMPVFLSEVAFDGYVWNRHAEHLGENGAYRLRFTDFDNAPKGREVHWNSLFAWYLRGLGELHFALTKDDPGASLRKSIFRMSIWANPILLIVALVVFGTLTALRFGPLSGAVIALAMVCVPTFYEGFMPAYPDHHGLISFFLLGMLFGIAWAGAGWVRGSARGVFAPPATLVQARHGMIFSALCGAAGLWFSALSTSLVLSTLGVAAIVSTPFFLRSGRRAGLEYHPELWKTWAFWGAGGSFFFYLLEYFPNHLGMRLEVNHPLYSLAFLGGGWAIYALTKWFAADRKAPFPWGVLGLCAAACALLPACILVGGPALYIPNDPFMERLWKNIAELLPLMTRIKLGGLTWSVAFGWFPVLLLAVAILQFVRKVDTGTKTVLVFMAIPILLLTALQFYQVRWGLLVGPLYGALAAVVIPQIWRLVPTDSLSRVAGALCLLGFSYLFVEPAFRNSFTASIQQYRAEPGKISLSPGQALALLHRQMARAILDNAEGRPVVLLSSPNSSCILSALGGFRTIGTLYWENVEGLKNAARALNAQNDMETFELLKKLGITHISLMTWENFIEPYFHILYPKDASGKPAWNHKESVEISRDVAKSPENSFGIRALFQNTIPIFTRPLIFPKNQITEGLKQTVLLLEFVPEQTRDEALLHLARFARIVEGNPVRAEFDLKDLVNKPDVKFEANAELGFLYLSQRRYDEAAKVFTIALESPNPAFRARVAALAVQGFLTCGRFAEARDVVLNAALRVDATLDTLMNAAWLLATNPSIELRDAVSANALIDIVENAQGAETANILLLRAAAAGAAGEYEKAVVFAQKAFEAAPGNVEISEAAHQMATAFRERKPWIPSPGKKQSFNEHSPLSLYNDPHALP